MEQESYNGMYSTQVVANITSPQNTMRDRSHGCNYLIIGVASYMASTAMAVPHFGPRSCRVQWRTQGVLRVLEHPHQLRHNSQLSSSVTNIITDNNDWQLLPAINLLVSKICSLNSSSHRYQPSLYSQLPSRMRLIRGVVNILGRG